MNKTLVELIQEQAGRELMSYQVYLSLSLWCGSKGYDGCQKFLYESAIEELGHEKKWLFHLNDYVDSLPETPGADSYKLEPTSLLDCFQQVLTLEEDGTGYINAISEEADRSKDQVTEAFVQWFLTEQVESVSQVRDMVRLLQKAGSNEAALMAVDEVIGEAP